MVLRKLIDHQIDELPRYENTLQTGAWWLQWVFSCPVKLLQVLNVVSQQAWYYRNIFSIAETGSPSLDIGCFASFLANETHEKEIAKNLKGGVKCSGSFYQYKGDK